MNKLCVLIILVISLIGCDGKYRSHRSNEDVLREANLLESFSEQLKYIPEQPTEIVTDTILSNGFNIKINYYSNENSHVPKTKKSKNGTVTKTYHKNFEAQFQVQKNNRLILDGIVNKELFHENTDNTFWQNAIMQYVWVDYSAMTEHSIQLHTSFNIPDTQIYKDFTLTIFDDGNIEIKEISLTNSKV
ncbi:DUF4738 domain-containing protein [Confluentibacter citreus]|uniref:DUF4738 domain-containing protein n=1 Tax=Confluentibacter citreus TaxID=2007307 RepID=UPI000C28F880|nr:DUF4738 domain-containing protein [Confluentibacter citreus]